MERMQCELMQILSNIFTGIAMVIGISMFCTIAFFIVSLFVAMATSILIRVGKRIRIMYTERR
jgi:hypothetical protein